jgi:hypothetical protein
MRNQIHNWLAGDWLVLGAHVPHWMAAIGALILVALLVAWFERPSRAVARSSLRSNTGGRRSAFQSSARSALE